jgi:hypothetical protein
MPIATVLLPSYSLTRSHSASADHIIDYHSYPPLPSPIPILRLSGLRLEILSRIRRSIREPSSILLALTGIRLALTRGPADVFTITELLCTEILRGLRLIRIASGAGAAITLIYCGRTKLKREETETTLANRYDVVRRFAIVCCH